MVKLNKTPTNGVTDAEDGKLVVKDANYTATKTVNATLLATYSGSTGYTHGVAITKVTE